MARFYPINTPLINYFFYPAALPGTNVIAPIAGGKLFFFADEDHNVMLPTYSDVSDPENPVVNTNPIVLGDAGEWPLFYLENRFYFIVLTDPTGDIDNPIETFSHYNPARLQGFIESYTNYIPNGQFWAHNRSGIELVGTEVNIAPGGLYFKRSAGSTSTDFIYFEPFPEYTENPSGNPAFYARLDCTSPDGGDDFKAIAQRYPNVNTFASSDQFYTFGVALASANPTPFTVEIYVVKNFGNGGSAQTATLVTSFDVTEDFQFFTHSFIFGSNEGKTIGTDSYVDLEIRFPTHVIFNAKITNLALAFGEVDLEFYAPEPTYFTQAKTLAGAVSNDDDEDAMNLYLPIRRGKNGFEYDDSMIGKVYGSFVNPEVGELLLNGQRLETAAFSSDGIPYQRLYNKIGNMFGTGANTAMGFTTNVAGNILLINQTAGAVTAAANGGTSPGFTFQVAATGATYDQMLGMMTNISPALMLIYGYESGHISSFSMSSDVCTIAKYPGAGTYDPQENADGRAKPLYQISNFAGATPDYAGKFIQFTIRLAAADVTYYLWFQVDGVGADPSPGGTGILVDLHTNDDVTGVIQKMCSAINRTQATRIVVTASPPLVGGEYWLYDTPGENFYVWYEVGGSGADPAVAARTGIKVTVPGAQTATQVAALTINAINGKYYALPTGEGMFLRGLDPNEIYDALSFTRFRFNSLFSSGGGLGSYQLPMPMTHLHAISGNSAPVLENEGTPGASNFIVSAAQASIDASGGVDNTPWNLAVNWIIKY